MDIFDEGFFDSINVYRPLMQSLVNMDLPDFCIVPILLPALTKHLQFHSVTLSLEKKKIVFLCTYLISYLLASQLTGILTFASILIK